MINLFEMVGAAFLFVMGMMTALWCVYFFKRNATVVDLGWAAGFFGIGWIYAILGDGYLPRRLALLAMVSIWSGRLFWYLMSRFDPKVEDPRYTALRERWGLKNSDVKFFFMFVVQGLLVLFLSLPFLIIARSESEWTSWEGWGFLVWAIGVVGEYFADKQHFEFARKPENKGRVCDVGLWRFSRHPNYFFEWVVWVGFALFALGTSFGWLSLAAPALMYYLLMYVSGVPLAEEQALQSKGEAYKQYQESTSVFFPFFKK